MDGFRLIATQSSLFQKWDRCATRSANLQQQISKARRDPGNVRIGYLASNFELRDDFEERSKTFVGSPQKIVSDIREFESLGVSFLAFSFLRETVEKTKAYSERFANEVPGKL